MGNKDEKNKGKKNKGNKRNQNYFYQPAHSWAGRGQGKSELFLTACPFMGRPRTGNSEFQIPNSNFQTPNSNFQTPNSKFHIALP
jgi:hypothetical protein